MKGSHVTTISLAIDREIDNRVVSEYPENQFLTVDHLESFYNYQTKGNNFEVCSSILSINDHCKKLKISSEVKKNSYLVIEEVPCPDLSVHYFTINTKKQRICAALMQIKSNLTNENDEIDTFQECLKYFTFSLEPEESNQVVRQKPQYCRGIEEGTASKPACAECTAVCAFTIEDILSKKRGIGQKDVIEELQAHKHPSTRKMPNSKLRNTQEGARELADHYIYSHGLTEKENF